MLQGLKTKSKVLVRLAIKKSCNHIDEHFLFSIQSFNEVPPLNQTPFCMPRLTSLFSAVIVACCCLFSHEPNLRNFQCQQTQSYFASIFIVSNYEMEKYEQHCKQINLRGCKLCTKMHSCNFSRPKFVIVFFPFYVQYSLLKEKQSLFKKIKTFSELSSLAPHHRLE